MIFKEVFSVKDATLVQQTENSEEQTAGADKNFHNMAKPRHQK